MAGRNTITDAAAPPILHLNGCKIANPAVLFDIDPARRAATSGPDSTVTLLILHVADGRFLFTASIREMAGTASPPRLAETAVGILIQKYLVPKCPAL